MPSYAKRECYIVDVASGLLDVRQSVDRMPGIGQKMPSVGCKTSDIERKTSDIGQNSDLWDLVIFVQKF